MASIAAGTAQFLSLCSSRPRSKLRRTPSSVPITTKAIRNEKSLSRNPSKPSKTKLSNTHLLFVKDLAISAATLFSINNLAITAVAGVLIHVAYKNRSLIGIGGGGGGGGVGGGGGGGGSGGGGGGGGFWKRLMSPAANADENHSPEWDSHGLPANIVVQFNKLNGFKKYKVSTIEFFDKVQSAVVGSEDSFFEIFPLTPDGVYTKAQLQKELETLAASQMFQNLDLEAKTNPDGTIGLILSFIEATWEESENFKCINVGLMPRSKEVDAKENMTANERNDILRNQERDYHRRIEKARPCMLPSSVHGEILQVLREGNVSSRMLKNISNRVQKWYHDEGYVYANVVNFGNLNTNEIVCEVMEGDITKVVIQFQDKLGNTCEGNTHIGVVKRILPKQLQRGKTFNIEAAKQALHNIESLSLFTHMAIDPRLDEKKEGGIIVDIKLQEADQKSADISTEWNIVPGRNGYPTLSSIQPGGTVSFQHRNIKGLNRSIIGSVTTSNFLNSNNDDLAFKLEYVHPYLDGVSNSRNRTLHASCFNNRKLSPVFTGVDENEVPPIWVDRAVVKTNITEDFTHQSKFTYGIVMEEITTRDERGRVSSNGQRVLTSGGISSDGPPTTLSGTGIDRRVFAQANITRDNTKLVNGAIVGEKNVFQLDQGLGIGTKFPIFNRHQLTMTRFIQLKEVEEGVGKSPPPVLVLHGHYGGCVGDLSSYDAFILGGPNSVRGYNMGEIGVARNMLELAAEIRIPVRNTQIYAFAEHGNDLGSSKDVKGHPTKVYRRMGQGSSYGVGAKFGQVRAEYVVDHNSGTGAWFITFGERF